ncbi:MAG: YHS domain-containing protein [Planctomycetes bacterium]|nr:YHS domain-containing protein [Planctomycetota bacterium]
MSFSLRAWLCSAAALLIVTPTIAIVAQTLKGQSAQPAQRAPKNWSPWPEKEPSPTATLKSAVQRELDALYAERGYKAPTLTVEQALEALKKAKALPSHTPAVRTVSAQAVPRSSRDRVVPTTEKQPSRLSDLLSRARLPKIRFLRLGSSAPEAKEPKVEKQPAPQPAGKRTALRTKSNKSKSRPAPKPTKAAPAPKTIQSELDALYARRGYKAPRLTNQEALNALRKAKALPTQDPFAAMAGKNAKPTKKSSTAATEKSQPKKKGFFDLMVERAKRFSKKKSKVQLTKAEEPAKNSRRPAPKKSKELGKPTGKATSPKPLQLAAKSKSASKPSPKAAQSPVAKTIQQKYQKIAERRGLTGLKGFCPVELRDHRELVDGKKQFASVYHSKTYHFSSKAAKAKFDRSPKRYAPAADGHDVVLLKKTGEQHEGTLDHAVWFQDRLYLFTSKVTMETFVASPDVYAIH